MEPLFAGIIGIILLIVLLAIGMPIAFSLAISGTIGIIMLDGFDVGVYSLGIYPFGFLRSWLLVAIPLFILMGSHASLAGVTSRAYEFAYRWLSKLPGGLAMASVAACAAVAATSGSSVATAGMMGAIAIPEMKRYGYDMRLASGATAAGGLLGILIPPSIILVIYGSITETSVGKLLIAGILPGVLTAAVYMVGISVIVSLRPSLAPQAPRFSWRERIRSVRKIWEVTILFMTVVLGIYLGIFTPTEAAAVGALVALIMALLRNVKAPSRILPAFSSTAQSTVMILAICLGASIFAQFLTLSGIPRWISEVIAHLQIHRFCILTLCLAVYIPLGMFLDTVSILLITMPIIFPIITAVGYNPIWFGVLVVKLEEISLITPPVGINVYVIKGVAPDIPLNDIFMGIIPFLVMEIVVIALLIAFPEISLWLPSIMIGK